ncbi:MAG: P-II family nitrogen regulator [Acidobacteriaceae bacterium]|nr:P-II family nitrogen regulator [Acidobacteriaceae bacterium]
MKEIIAIIRPKKVGPTRNALEQLGFNSMTATAVLGRGAQRGIASEVRAELSPELLAGNAGGMKYVPKRLVSIMVHDFDVDKVVKAIIEVNQTSQIGDGKIFVCTLEDAIRVRTQERGESAV